MTFEGLYKGTEEWLKGEGKRKQTTIKKSFDDAWKGDNANVDMYWLIYRKPALFMVKQKHLDMGFKNIDFV